MVLRGPTGRPLGPPPLNLFISFVLCEPHSKAFLIPLPPFVTRQVCECSSSEIAGGQGGPLGNFICMDPECGVCLLYLWCISVPKSLS